MQTSRSCRTGALIVGLALVAAACSGEGATPATTAPGSSTGEPPTTDPADTAPATAPPDTRPPGTEPDGTEPADTEPDGTEPDGTEPADTEPDDDPPEPPTDDARGAECEGTSDGVLTVGTILPVTGDLAFLGAPQVAGAHLAVEDINAAGGVLGRDAVLHQGDSGDVTTALAGHEVDRLLALGADVIVGAASSAVSFTVIDEITGSCVIQFSPANGSPDFTTYADDGLYFRTAPSDTLQGRVLSNLVLDDGNVTASVIFRQGPDGQGLAGSFVENFEASGGTIDESLSYSVDADSFDARLDPLVDAGSDAIIVIGFDESATILTAMHERGIGPLDTSVYGADGNIGGIGAELADPSIIAGMRGTEPSAGLDEIADFTSRLDGLGEMGGVYSYGAETYDAIVITALATLVAGTDDPTAVAAEINDITRSPGDPCSSFRDCKGRIEGGVEIDYVGIGGAYDFVDAGEPAAATFRIATYDGDATPDPELDEYVFAG